MNRFFMAVALVCALALPAAASAAPKLKATPSVKASRLVVTLTSSKAFTKKTRPRGVSVKAGGASYKLKQASRKRKKSVWRSPKLDDAVLASLAGK